MTTNDQIQQLEKRLDKRFKEMQQEIDMRLAPLHDYMIGQQAIYDNKPQSVSSVNSKDLMIFILKLLGGIAGILAAAAWINKTK